MNIFIEKTQERLTKTFSGSALELLNELAINLEEILIVRNGELVTEDTLLSDQDEIRLLSVVSGG
jgi:sulfur carrier protein ThiS